MYAYKYSHAQTLAREAHTHSHTRTYAQLQTYIYTGHIYASISCIHMLLWQRHIPGLWMHVKDTAILAIEAHETVYICVGARVVVYVHRDS
jgi:hypothetical protein